MPQYDNIVLINSSEIIDIVRHTLSKIDPRLIDHGERVAYIAERICSAGGYDAGIDGSKLFVLCVLHDIGAYKTDEIDDMVRFETETPFDHSIYGYLFLKNARHLSEYAEAILYHHTDYSALREKGCPYAEYAGLIHLADRADILLHSAGGELSALRALAGSRFDPRQVEALLRAEERCGLSRRIASGEYRREVAQRVGDLGIKNSEIMDYLRLLVYAIDFRSPYTVTHTADTTLISLETGKLLGLGEREQQTLYIGAFLHDIGKIAVPYQILEKPDKLTPKEFEIMKRHIPEGEQILRGVVSDEICDIALRHHEKLDGSGYSRGLSAAELSLPQRILAVSDILSALAQQRSYKGSLPKEEVLGILTGMARSGKIDPLVTDTVRANYDLIERNAQLSRNPVRTLYDTLVSEYRERKREMQR